MLCFSVVSIRSFELEALPQKNKNNNKETAQRYLLLGCSLTQFTPSILIEMSLLYTKNKAQNKTTQQKLSYHISDFHLICIRGIFYMHNSFTT